MTKFKIALVYTYVILNFCFVTIKLFEKATDIKIIITAFYKIKFYKIITLKFLPVFCIKVGKH